MTTSTLAPTPTRELERLIDELGSSSVLDAVSSMSRLDRAAVEADPERAFGILAPLAERHASDPLLAYLATHALAGVRSPEVDRLLTRLLVAEHPGAREHAAWALSRRRPYPAAVPALVALAETGGFGRMMAELALEEWLQEVPELVWRTGATIPDWIEELSRRTPAVAPRARQRPGLRIAQVLMQGRVDPDLSHPGAGDGGGLITLQVGLTRELARHEAVSEVHLLARRIEGDHPRLNRREEKIGANGRLTRLGFGPSGYLPTSKMWAFRAELEREMRGFLTDERPFDAIHLRFADVGTFVASRVAMDLNIPIFFTLAPDPHASIFAAEQDGSLRRDNFAEADLDQHLVFRVWLIDWMLQHAERLALLPRPSQREQLRELLGVDIASSDRFVVIPEGVDSAESEEARRTAEALQDEDLTPILADLTDAILEMPPWRRGLPLLLSVGRLNGVKGMDRVVEAWVDDEAVHSQYNLVIVGGNLGDPSPEELATLQSISSVLGRTENREAGLVLLGGRSHREVSLLMAASVSGVGESLGPNGIYVSGSEKEEFGLAIVEALAAGLPVVAPVVGGPATYIDHEFTGFLADTRDVEGLREGIRWADGVRHSEVRADAARRLVRAGYSIAAMAEDLVGLYSVDAWGSSAS